MEVVLTSRSKETDMESFTIHKCPHCTAELKINELPHQGLWESFRVCPECGGLFTADPDSKYRQALLIVVLLISLVFTLLLYYENESWLIPALASYVALGALLYWGNKKIYFVPYQKRSK